MLKNYIIMAIRSSFKNGATSVINFLGLTIGLVCCFLIFLNVSRELSYDRFHSKADHIFRILSIDKALGISNNNVGITIPALANGMKSEIANVENVVRISAAGRSLVRYKENTLYADNLMYTEPSFFELFDFKLKEGDYASCLKNPNTAIITESMAKRIFGNEEPMGKIFSADGTDNLQVTGILKDNDLPSHFKFDVVISINPSVSDTTTASFLNSWNNIALVEFALLKNPEKKAETIVEMDTIMRRHKVIDVWKATLQPLKEVHLYSGDILFDNFNTEKGNIKYVQSLAWVAIIILLIACFNYMNLATARSSKRAKEMGIRKTSGALRSGLILQHLAEAIVQVLISVVIACVVVEIIDRLYHVTTISISQYIVQNPSSLLYLLGLVLVLGIVSGLYPAMILSSFKPSLVLKGTFETGKQGIWLRRILVSVQFIASFVMIVSTLVVLKQLKYTLNKDKGFNSSQILNIQLDDQKMREKFETLKTEVSKLSHVKSISSSGSMPGQGFGRIGITPEGALTTDNWIVSAFGVDENYIPVMEMKMKEGENFRKDMSQNPVPIIVNESLLKATGWSNGLNKTIKLGKQTNAQIIGVVKDFHFTSLRHKIEPVILLYRPGANSILSIKLDIQDMAASIKAIQNIWTGMSNGVPFEYKFFDESYKSLFEKEQDFSKIFMRFTLLSIFISILGLFGLAAFSAEQRTKEIGIRKIFGGSTRQMVQLQSYEYLRLIMAAMIIAFPLAILIMHNWLNGFAYRVSMNIVPFVLSAAVVLIVTLLTVSIHSFRTARKNPAETVKYE
jgi:putative ABC transport system permease protein